jgi:hypothetical protein
MIERSGQTKKWLGYWKLGWYEAGIAANASCSNAGKVGPKCRCVSFSVPSSTPVAPNAGTHVNCIEQAGGYKVTINIVIEVQGDCR